MNIFEAMTILDSWCKIMEAREGHRVCRMYLPEATRDEIILIRGRFTSYDHYDMRDGVCSVVSVLAKELKKTAPNKAEIERLVERLIEAEMEWEERLFPNL